jgi:uncharacterized membrane protein YdbT with pleckstrin-like domain
VDETTNASGIDTSQSIETTDLRLMRGERIVFTTTKHWASPVSDSWRAALLIIASLALAWLQTDQTAGLMGFVNRVLNLLEVALFLGGVGWIVYNIVAWRSAAYTVTNLRLLGAEGLLRKRETDSLLSSISDVRMRQSAVGRALGYGDLQILTSSGEAGADKFTSVRSPIEFKKQIVEQKVASASPAMPPTAAVSASASTSTPAVSQEQAQTMAAINSLAGMRDSGAITTDEYNAKKAELLGRL